MERACDATVATIAAVVLTEMKSRWEVGYLMFIDGRYK